MKKVMFFILTLIVFTVPSLHASAAPLDSAGFYCRPYTAPFSPNFHYMPEGSFCTFAGLPTDRISQMRLYRGTIGNSTLVGSGTSFNEATSSFITVNAFTNAQNDESYFAVAYDSTVSDDFDDYLTVGTNTTPTGNFKTIPFKWGPKSANEFEPVIIIPGILGSWEKNGVQIIDPLLNVYSNLINSFKASGYVDGETLFPFAYDWRNSNTTTAELLRGKIQSVKSICHCDHVDIIAHSMGGLVAWQYIESTTYQHDIDQAFFVATPFMGASFAYQTWEAGVIHFGNTVQDLLLNRIFLREAEHNGYTNTFDYMRNKPINSVKELLPIFDYLVDGFTLRTYPNNYPRNTFLEDLRSRWSQNGGFRGVRVNTIAALENAGQTPLAFFVTPSTQLPKWEHGSTTSTFYDMGDGIVPYLSITDFIGTPNQTFEHSDHVQVVTDSENYIFNNLNNKDLDRNFNLSYLPDFGLLYVLLKSPIDMQIIAPDGKRLGRDLTTNTELDEIPDAFYSGFIGDNEYAVIPDPLPGTYTIKTIGTGSGGEYTIATDYIDGQGDVSTELSGSTATNQVLTNNLVVSTTSRTITLVANNPDNTPPVITITNPRKYGLYARTESVLLTATINDASSVATSTYWFNGKKINPALPLAFGSSTPLIDKVAVSATDSAGNIATSSLTFFVVKTKTSCLTDIVQIVATVLTDKTLPDKTTLQQLINDCKLLTKR